ncbi:MAG TPA: hypothetical protein VLC09_08950 [Polyangiaceae bacterium]|nr:hypothetical protein [Polyangiaceae bacterium]
MARPAHVNGTSDLRAASRGAAPGSAYGSAYGHALVRHALVRRAFLGRVSLGRVSTCVALLAAGLSCSRADNEQAARKAAANERAARERTEPDGPASAPAVAPTPAPPPRRWEAQVVLMAQPDVYSRDASERRGKTAPPSGPTERQATLSLTFDGDEATGQLTGSPLGALGGPAADRPKELSSAQAHGRRMDDGELRLRLEGDGLRGWVVAHSDGEGWRGQLQLGRPDGSESWRAEVLLAPATPPSPPRVP